MKIHSKQSHVDLIKELKTAQVKNKEWLEKGSFIRDYIRRLNIDPRLLRNEHQKAIKMKVDKPKVEAILKPLQEKLLERMKPSEREIIWVIGQTGNEGKTWFQKYLEDINGSLVFQSNIKKRRYDTMQILSKQIVSLIDLFLFNVPRCFNMDDFPYEMLEEIKDGESTKADGSRLKFNNPNILLVFSNEKPDEEKMSKDRWSIYFIEGQYLLQTDGSMVV